MGELVTGNYFQELGVRAQLGRTLLPSDEVAPGRHPVVVLSDALWRRDFGADPDIVGKTIHLNTYAADRRRRRGAAFHGTIVSFDIEVFVPIDDGAADPAHRGARSADGAVRHRTRRC